VNKPLNMTVLGPTGRLGRAICEAILDDPEMALVGCVVRAESAVCGQDMGGVLGREPIGCIAEVSLEDAAERADIVIDASLASMTVSAAERLASMGGPAFLTGVTGFNPDQETRLMTTTHRLPVLRASNFSLGVAIAELLVRQAAVLPAREWDIEISETHHKMKADAPSGTAVMLARAAAGRRGVSLEEAAIWSREGTTGARETGTIGFAVNRGGSIVGEHAVRFMAEMEELTISHRAFDRRVFARGAMAATRWMHNGGNGRDAGLYSMQDVVSDV
jgi:4-hydroxy-tetrahydrodipicolinate reductase